MSKWTKEELETADRIYKNDVVNKQSFLNHLLTMNKSDREAYIKRLNKSVWRHLWEIFLMGADYIGSAATGKDPPSIVGAYADALDYDCKLKNDIAYYEALIKLGFKSIVIVGGVLLIKKL